MNYSDSTVVWAVEKKWVFPSEEEKQCIQKSHKVQDNFLKYVFFRIVRFDISYRNKLVNFNGLERLVLYTFCQSPMTNLVTNLDGLFPYILLSQLNQQVVS